MPETFTFEEAANPAPQSFTFEEANRFTFEEASQPLSPLHAEMAAAGVNMGSGGDRSRLPQASQDDRLQSAMVRGATHETFNAQEQAAAEEQQRLAEEDAIWREAWSNQIREPSLRERLRTHPIAQRLLGPPAAEQEARAELGLSTGESPGQLASKAMQFTTAPPIVAEASRAMSEPLIQHLPESAQGVYRGVRETLLGFPLLAPAGKLALGAFATEWGWHLPEQRIAYMDAIRNGDKGGAAEILTQNLLTGGLFGLGAGHKSAREFALGLQDKLSAEVPGITPDLANRIAVNLAAPGTMRPQESRGNVAPAEAATRPEMVQFERVPLFNDAGEVVDVQIRPRIREVVVEDAPRIEPVEGRRLKEDVEGGKLGFRRTAEDFIQRKGAEAQREVEPRQPPPAVPVSEPAATPETITRPGKPGNEGAASEILAEREERLKPRPSPRRPSDRPWDILDEIEGQVGGKIDPALIRQANPDWRPVGAARELFRVGGRAADVVLNALTYEGPRLGLRQDMGLQEFGEAINAAAQARKGWRGQAARERRLMDQQAREAQTRSQFEQKVLAGERPKSQQRNVQQVRVDNLVVGDRFKVQDHKFEITEMLTDEDGNLVSVTLKDGPKFGVQTVGDVGTIHIDKGTLRMNRKGREFAPAGESAIGVQPSAIAPEPTTKPPTLKGNQKQGDLLGSGDVEFNLYGERTGDGARIAAERAQREATEQAAKEFAAKHQQEVPGLVSGTSAEAWADRTIANSRGQTNVSPLTGLPPELLAAYVVKGAALLERGVRKFSDWSLKMIAEHGDSIRPHLRRIFEEASAGLGKVRADDGSRKQRKLAIRGSVSPEVAPAHQQRLKTGAEAFYEPQDMTRVEDAVAHRTSEELASVSMVQPDGPNNVWVAAQLELYRRAVAAGKLDAGWAIMEQAMKAGTSLGQLVNQFKLLRGATPDGVLVAINRRLQESGFDPMRPSEQIRTRRLAEDSIRDNAVWKESERVYREAPTPENFERVKRAREEAVQSDVALQRKITAYQPRAFWDMLTTLLKGNLLAPISQAANVVGNTTNLLIRGGARGTASIVDSVDAFLRNRPRSVATVPLRGARAAAGAVVRAIPDSARALWKGASDADLSKADVQRGLRPLVAMRDLFRSQVEGPQRNGKTPFSQRLLMALEASPFSMHAAAQLRLLGAVDKPFKAAARARLITEALKLRDGQRPKGTPSTLTKENIRRAVEYPELFLDAATLERIDNEAAYAVYQGRNPLTTRINVALHGAKPSTRFLVSTIAPYVSTPINLIGEWLSYNPAVAGVNVVRQASKGNTRGASIAAGKFVAGSMMLAAGYWLYQKGLIAPSLDQQDEQQKARVLAGMTLPPHHINLSGLKRALKGGDPTWQAGDRSIDVLRGGGVAGALMLSATDVLRQREREPNAGGLDYAARVAGDQWTQMLQYGVNQSFLKGTANLLEAVQEGKMDSWAATYVDTLTAIPLPGTLNAFARATRENKLEVRGDALDERLENQLRSRLGAFGLDDNLPFKRDLWGRPVPETPAGNLPWLYHTLDVSKGQRIPSDDAALMLYGLWRQTANNAVIPTPPDANLTIGRNTYQLDREQLSRLQELVGTARKSLVDRVMLNDRFANLGPDRKIAVLRKVWERGAEIGNRQFWRENGPALSLKPVPSGFVAPAR